MSLRNQVIYRLKCRVFLFKKDGAFAGQADIAVNDNQRHRDRIRQREDRFFAHVTGVENDGVALPIGQHLHRFLFALRRIVTIGHNQLLAVRFSLPRGLL
ncbi:hypothetical protein SDC9_148451 [bioreactor metagenome]|uniref:Uncharacterized protein n=1 Tax=bioreactor metagenome TaxID=1076179 RepID=A0A645EGV4_9ZZZZ